MFPEVDVDPKALNETSLRAIECRLFG